MKYFLILLAWGIFGLAADEEILIQRFSTLVEKQNSDVKKNIALAVEKLNGYKIEPNSTFSFSDIVGEASIQNGFVAGRVFYWNEAIYEPGGGLCQVSSTVFNLLLLSGFVIKERHKHSQPVSYVPMGLDATIFYGKKNLRMQNPHSQSFRLVAEITDSTLTFSLYGNQELLEKYELETEEEEHELPILKKEKSYRNAYTVSVFRKKYRGENLLETSLLYKDFIPAVYFK
ncbi:MAG TPA: VanW family protein [Leptospiraceae bacterium]|nr:VanW family protein [Leptospiraceae bacterium]HMX33317.1 VanW family protein [Leptospiraceae bacterium]HMY32072.1 VanW family protein [Leptospiraceae bacterium]HMZ63995.1 VanW family protein [Leptospiraceae bacterium]HNA07365.1 VanW family protein [Leptospiraceae bacterium]